MSFGTHGVHFSRLIVVVTRYTGAYFPLIISLQFSFQSYRPYSVTTFTVVLFSTTFKATILIWFGIQSHHLNTIWHSEPPSPYCLTFRATISFQFAVKSHHSFLVTAFKAAISSQLRHLESFFSIWCSEPPSFFSLAFRATISFQFGV